MLLENNSKWTGTEMSPLSFKERLSAEIGGAALTSLKEAY